MLWEPLAERLAPLLSLRIESQVRRFVPARMPPPEDHVAQLDPAKSAPQDASQRAHDTHAAAADADTNAQDAKQRQAALSDIDGSVGGTNDSADSGEGKLPPKTLLTAADLPFFVDLDAWSLTSGRTGAGHQHPLSRDPHLIPEQLLQFVAYVPATHRQPVAIQGSHVHGSPGIRGFVMPSWGGVNIHNIAAQQPAGALPASAMELHHGVALQQLRQLLHLPDRWPLATQPAAHASGPLHVPPGKHVVALWELDAMMRQRFEHLVVETADAITTLLELVRTGPSHT